MATELPTTITIDGVAHDINMFSDSVKNLITIRMSWAADLTKAQLEATKCETAIRALDGELAQLAARDLEE